MAIVRQAIGSAQPLLHRYECDPQPVGERVVDALFARVAQRLI
jgi:hypothetical protein